MNKYYFLNKNFFIYLFIIVLSIESGWTQTPAKYWIAFKDKKNSSYSINRPYEFLSQRAIEKRQRFNIPITEEDLPVNKNYIDQILNIDTTIILFTQSKWMNGITVYCKDSAALQKIKALPFVKQCECNSKTKQEEKPYSQIYAYQPNGNENISPIDYKNIKYGKANPQIRTNNIHWLHRMGFLGQGIVMSVQDGGFHNVDSIPHFRKLITENRLLGVRNFVQPDINPMRAHSHGTMVLSCIASYLPDTLVGTAPLVAVYLAQTEDGRSEYPIEEDNWIAGLEWADSLGCDVVNSSLGYTHFEDTSFNHRHEYLTGEYTRVSKAANKAAQKGIVVCNSAGNEGQGTWHYIGFPADAKNILTVGSVQPDKRKSAFSSFGYHASGNIKPDACAVGSFTWVGMPNGKTAFSFGTSFSSPLLAGMVACLWQSCPDKTPLEIIEAIHKSGSQYSKPDEALGYGITDFFKAYNLLKNNGGDIVLNNEKKILLAVNMPDFVVKNGKLTLGISSQCKSNITIRIENENKQLILEKKIKANTKARNIKLKNISLLNASAEYALGTMTFFANEQKVFVYTIGEER